MKIKSDYAVRKISDAYYAINLSSPGGMIKLNETGAFLFNLLKEEKTIEELACALVSEYGISKETAMQDAEDFAASAKENKILD